MGELVKERTDGRICIEVYDSAQLGEEADTIEQTRFGVIDLNRVSLGPFNNLVEETKVVSLPYIFRSVDHMHKVMDGEIGEEILAAFEPYDLIGLAFYDGGSRSFYNREKPIDSIDDMEGMKFRVMQSDVFVDMVDALGANATPMPYGEVYSGIQTGVIDRCREQLALLRVLRALRGGGVLYPRRAPDRARGARDVQAELGRAFVRGSGDHPRGGEESVPYMREQWQAREEESEAKVREAGVEIVSDIDKQPFIDAMGPSTRST